MSSESNHTEGVPTGSEKGARDRLLHALTRASAAVALLRGPALVYEFANELYCRLARIDPDPVGMSFASFSRSDDRLRTRALLERVYKTGEPLAAREFRIKLDDAPSSHDSYFNITLDPTRDASGNVDGILIHGVDVTELVLARKEVELQREALRATDEQLRSIVEGTDVGLAAVDLDLRFTVAMGRALTLAGLHHQDMIGVRAHEMFPQYVHYLERAVAGEKVVVVLEWGGRHLEVNIQPQRDPIGAIVGAIAVVIDVSDRVRADTEHKKLQAQLLQVQKLESLGVLAGGIAHDFNNLLTAIVAGASAAAIMLLPESPAHASLGDVILAARRAADLTRQLLAYSGKAPFDVRPIDFTSLVRELARLLEPSIPKQVQVRLDLADSIPAIEADGAQIQQVVMNLVINGAEAIGAEGGTVLVTTGVHDIDDTFARGVLPSDQLPAGRYVRLEIHDTGCGMDDATKEKIFDPFFTTKFTGRGLGLAAVLGIVRAHKGAINVHSSIGRGTTFKVLLPASAKEVRIRAHTERSRYRGSGLVLVIDDDKTVRTAVCRLLKHFGFDVVEAAGGRDGVRLFEQRIDLRLVILDMMMPEMSGEETFLELQRIRAEVPVILSSGYDEIEATRRFVSKGLAAFLAKPFTPEELAGCIIEALG